MRKNEQGLLEDLNPPGLVKPSEGVSYKSKDLLQQTSFEKNKTYFHIMGNPGLHVRPRGEPCRAPAGNPE